MKSFNPSTWGREKYFLCTRYFLTGSLVLYMVCGAPTVVVSQTADNADTEQQAVHKEQDSAQQDGTQQDSAQQDSAQQDGTQQDSAQQDSAQQDGTQQDSGNAPGAAQRTGNAQKIYSQTGWVVDAVRTLLVEQGIAVPFSSGPYSQAELLQNLRRIKYRTLSPAGRSLYDALQQEFVVSGFMEEERHDGGTGLVLDAGLELTVESYLQTDRDENRWEYGYEKRRPFFRLPLELWGLESLYATMELDLKKNYPSFKDQPVYDPRDEERETVVPHPASNLPTDFREIDLEFPFRSFIALGGDHWGIQYGRDRISWGPGRTGNLVISDYADYHDFVRFTTFWNRFKYSYFWINMDRYDPVELEDDRIDSVRTRNFIGHRLDFRPTDKLNIGLSEAYIIAKETVELRYAAPVMLYHNYFVWYTNSAIIASLDMEYSIHPGVRVYGQFALNQFALPVEGDYAEGEPDAWGVLGGVDTRFPVGQGYLLSGLETVYTDPWFTIHDFRHTGFTASRDIVTENIAGTARVRMEKPLGYWAGPDYLGGEVYGAYRVPFRYEIGSTVALRFKGRNDHRMTLEDFRGGSSTNWAPTGMYPERTVASSIYATVAPWFIPGFNTVTGSGRTLELGTELWGIWVTNRDQVKDDTSFTLRSVIRVTVGF
jgi:hypothetical protein